MISSKRRKQAKREGMEAAIATKCDPYKTKNTYSIYSAQWEAFNNGWNYIRKRFKFLRKVK